MHGVLGPALNDMATGYSFVYHIEIALLFATLIAIGPLVKSPRRAPPATATAPFGAAEFAR